MIKIDADKYNRILVHGDTEKEKSAVYNFRENTGGVGTKYEGGVLVLKSFDKRWIDTSNYFFSLVREYEIVFTEKYTLLGKRNESIRREIIDGCEKTKDLTIRSEIPQPEYIKLPLRNYQLYGVELCTNLPFHALLWEMRTGKTPTILVALQKRIIAEQIKRILVIAPLSILEDWAKEVDKFLEIMNPVVLTGGRQKKLDLMSNATEGAVPPVIIMNYESVTSLMDTPEFDSIVNDGTALICDESSKVKNPSSKAAKAIIKLSGAFRYKYIITGTPTPKGYGDVYSQFSILDNSIFGLSYESFVEEYFIKRNFSIIPRYGTAERIQEKIASISSRFLRIECVNIPKIEHVVRDVEIIGGQLSSYISMCNECLVELEGVSGIQTASIILVKMLRLSQILTGSIVMDDGSVVYTKENAKLDALRDIFEEVGGSQIIVWSRFKNDFRLIRDVCNEYEFSYSELHGDISIENRNEGRKKFQSGESKVFIGNPQTGGYGINLTSKNPHIVVFFSNSYSYGDRQQCESRDVMEGQPPITYIDLVGYYRINEGRKNTIDHIIMSILRGKKSVSEVVTKDNIRELLDLR